MYLFKTPVKSKDLWRDKMRPVYVIARDKKDAIALVTKHIKSPYYVDSALRLGEQVSGIMFHS